MFDMVASYLRDMYLSWKARWALIVVGFVTIVYLLGPRWKADGAEGWFAEPDGRPLIMAHGGAKELFPENTMVAFDGSAALGVDILEMDVSMTYDGVLVTIHGPNLGETTEGTGPVSGATYAEIQSLDAASHFSDPEGNNEWEGEGVRHPALRDVLKRYRSTRLKFVIELKDRGEEGKRAAARLARILRQLDLEERVMVASFSTETLNAFRNETDGRVPTSGSEKELRRMVIPSIFGLDRWWVIPGPVAALQIPTEGAGFDLTKKKIITHAHQHHQPVHYWTIDDPGLMRQLAERGADGIITDRPDVAREVFNKMGYELPEPLNISELQTP